MRVAILSGDGAYKFPIVGESHYQENIETIVGPKTEASAQYKCSAALLPEPANPYDKHAVRVDIQGRTVGYLSRDVAPAFLNCLATDSFAAAVAGARIVGGWKRGTDDEGSFGVLLDATLPFKLNSSSPQTTTEVSAPDDNSTPVPIKLATKKRSGCGWIVALILFGFLYFVFSGPSERSTKVVEVLKSQFGAVCEPKLEGLFSDTLRLDWTAATKKINFITIMASIGKSKETIYASGIRYLKFPNSSGGYNIIDWKTGEKTSVSERARYYFSD